MTIKDDFIKKVLIAMFIFLSIFTVVMVVIFLLTGNTPDTLILSVFGACMGEYSICGLIKKSKEKEKTERMKEGFVEDPEIYFEDEVDEDYEEEINDVVAAAFEPIDEYISSAHNGDIEEEAID